MEKSDEEQYLYSFFFLSFPLHLLRTFPQNTYWIQKGRESLYGGNPPQKPPQSRDQSKHPRRWCKSQPCVLRHASRGRSHHFCDFTAKDAEPGSNHKETSDKVRDRLQKSWLVILRSVKVMKCKEKLRNSSRFSWRRLRQRHGEHSGRFWTYSWGNWQSLKGGQGFDGHRVRVSVLMLMGALSLAGISFFVEKHTLIFGSEGT